MPGWAEEPVTLDKSDTLHSAKGKLDNSAKGRPVVILASDCRLADNVLTYRLLARTSERFSAPIAVVTGNPYWRKLAREHGLRAYPSLDSLSRARRQSAISVPESIADALFSTVVPVFSPQGWIITGVLVLMVLAGAYFLLPVMKVAILTATEDFRHEVNGRADVSVPAGGAGTAIPARVLEHRFTISDTIPTTGEKNVGKERAKGEVTFLNGTLNLVNVPAGTVLSTATGQKFTTVSAVSVGAAAPGSLTAPAGSPTPPPEAQPTVAAGAPVRVQVIAVEPGAKGNVPALAISKFESDTFRSLTVFNEHALAGGTEARGKVGSVEDRAKLKEQLLQKTQSQALTELRLRARQSESLVPHSLQVQVEREDYDKGLDEEAEQLKGTVSVVATAIAFSNQELNTMVEREWKRAVPKGYRPVSTQLNINPPEVLDAASQSASLRIRVLGRIERVVEVDELSGSLRGMSVQDAKARLAKLESPLKLMKLDVWPGWAGRAYRVEIQTVR